MFRKESLLPVGLAGLTVLFIIISALVYLSRGNGFLIKQKLKLGALILALTATLAGTSGCDQGEVISCYVPYTPYPVYDLLPATSPDQLMANFQLAYEDMNIEFLRDVLHEDLKLLLQSDTVAAYDLPRDFFSYEEELSIHTNIFSGNPIYLPDGAVPGISSITFRTFERQDEWAAAPPTDPNFPNAFHATYNVTIEVTRPGGNTIVVSGLIRFYVVDVDEGEAELYRLIGQVDLTTARSQDQDTLTWGALHALYR